MFCRISSTFFNSFPIILVLLSLFECGICQNETDLEDEFIPTIVPTLPSMIPPELNIQELDADVQLIDPNLLDRQWILDQKVIDRSLTIRLYNDKHRTRPVKLAQNAQLFELDGYEPKHFNVIVFHGWMSGYSPDGWMDDYKDAVMKKMNYKVNVFLVDWSPLSKSINYFLSAASVQDVGRSMAEFTWNSQIDSNRTYCIGHSLGSHVCGAFGGKWLDYHKPLKKIWALDPARPGFTREGVKFRLDKSHAELVEVLHTDCGTLGLGLPTQIGHFDYYLNDGEHQPGCPATFAPLKMVDFFLKDQASCNHGRAPEFLMTLFDECQPVAYQCDSYYKFSQGECAECGADGSKCRMIDNFAIAPPNLSDLPPLHESSSRFFLDTGPEKPFCLFHYQVTIVTSNMTVANEGTVHIQLVGQQRDSTDIQLSKSLGSTFEAGRRYSLLYTSRKSLGKVYMARLHFSPSGLGRLLYVLTRRPFNVEYLTVRFMSSNDSSVRDNLSGKLCNPNSQKNMRTGSGGLTTDLYVCN